MGEFTLDTTEVGEEDAVLAEGFDASPYFVVAFLLVLAVIVLRNRFRK